MDNSPSRERPLDRLEPLLWGGLLLLAALLRLIELGAAPLNSAEATTALAAFRAARGVATVVPAQVAPLPLHLNVLLLAAFDGGDGLTRWIPALAGVALVLTPLMLRRYLGRWGALAGGLMLALSPTALYFSRIADGTTLAALGVMVLVGCAAQFLDSWRGRLATIGGGALAVALTAGPGAWGLLLGLLIALGIALWLWRQELEWLWPLVRPALGKGLAAAGLGVLLLGSGLGLNPGGLAATAQQFAAWAGRFIVPLGAPASPSFNLLLVYEPLILIFGLAGATLAVRKRHGMGLLWTFWAAVGALQLALMPGRQPQDMLWLLLPLVGLAGLAAKELAAALQAEGRWLNEGIYLLISLLIWAYGGISLAHYARWQDSPSLWMAAVALLLQILLASTFGLASSMPDSLAEDETPQLLQQGVKTTLRALALSLGVALAVLSLSISWGVSHLRPVDAREPLVSEPLGEIETIVEVVQHTSRLSSGSETALPVAFLDRADPVLAWALRQHEQQVIADVDQAPPLVIAAADAPLAEGYFGETLTLRRAWVLQEGLPEAMRWWVFRESSLTPAAVERVTLWTREDLATAELGD